VHVSNDLGRLLNQTDKLAQQRKDAYVSSELFVLAALDDRGALGDMLRKAGAAKGAIEQAIDRIRGGQKVDDPNAEEQRQALEKYNGRPDPARRAGQARPGDRPRRRDPPGDPDPAAAHQDNPS